MLPAPLLRKYPDIKVEIISDYGLTDIVTQRFGAGVRDGEQVAKDMIAVRTAPDARMAIAHLWREPCGTCVLSTALKTAWP